MQDRGPAAYLAEFIGTLALVFFVVAVVSLYVTPTFNDFAVIGLVHVFALFFLIQTLALISGAHFNPAVTIALTVIRQIKAFDALVYIVAQLAGGLAGALLAKLLFGEFNNADVNNYGAAAISDRLDGKVGLGMLGEFIGTFFLMWTIVAVAVNPRAAKDWAALAIGATLGLGVMTIGPLTGASFNPARAFGPAVAGDAFGDALDFLLAYVLAPVLGAVAAALVFFYLFITPGKKGPEGMEPVG